MNRYEKRASTRQRLPHVSTAIYSFVVLAVLGGGYLLFSAASSACGSPEDNGQPQATTPPSISSSGQETSPLPERCSPQQESKRASSELTEKEREDFYHLPEGNEYFSLPMLRALPSKASLEKWPVDGKYQSFLDNDNLERFGLLADPNSPEGLPIGLALRKGSKSDLVGFNCAACHVGELHYQGKHQRVDGAPNLFDLKMFFDELGSSIEASLTQPEVCARVLETLGSGPGADQASRAAACQAEAAREAARERKDARDQGTARQLPLSSQAKKLSQDKQLPDQEDATVQSMRNILKGYEALLSVLPNRDQPHIGPGRVDAFGGARAVLFPNQSSNLPTAPVSISHIWGLQEQYWFHWDANTNSIMERNAGEALSMGATPDTIQLCNLAKLENLSQKLQAPCWPRDGSFGVLETASVSRGEQVFTQHCARCHNSPAGVEVPLADVGTDSKRLDSFNQKMNDGMSFHDKLEESLEAITKNPPKCEGLDLKKFPEPRGANWYAKRVYLAKPLTGIWATAPYLHNGSVPTLWDLLRPVAERPPKFRICGREYDPDRLGFSSQDCGTSGFEFDTGREGNTNVGHEYGTDLPEQDKRDLLEYIKAL